MPSPLLPRLGTIVMLATLCAACASTRPASYRQDPIAQASPEVPPQEDRVLYLDLIAKMQKQGAFYASLAHVDAYRQRYGDSPALRLLHADALRETGQRDAALAAYTGLTTGPQAAAAWHGIGLIAARNDDDARAETALARAVQLQPLNTDYLGDLGFARLRAGHWDQAQAPLAMAAELAPGNVKANANLAVWALLRGQPETAERIIRDARLPDTAREEIQRLAQQLRQRAASRTARVSAVATPPLASNAPATAPARERTPRLAAEADRPTASGDARLAPSMLERFGAPDTATGNTP
ncbi:Flp pilus assembly protein TadD [Stenotrophomonas sp. LGBM10]|uniref:Flp pilus assembly protein TadD n=1 Tax=Stenotrophomonas sp. LGBM10 TaxID=3390038 RepID=UPI00398BA774